MIRNTKSSKVIFYFSSSYFHIEFYLLDCGGFGDTQKKSINLSELGQTFYVVSISTLSQRKRCFSILFVFVFVIFWFSDFPGIIIYVIRSQNIKFLFKNVEQKIVKNGIFLEYWQCAYISSLMFYYMKISTCVYCVKAFFFVLNGSSLRMYFIHESLCHHPVYEYTNTFKFWIKQRESYTVHKRQIT